jgi:hypothetical protein
VTTLLDGERYPLCELATLFHQRWEIEVYQPECTSIALLYQVAA